MNDRQSQLPGYHELTEALEAKGVMISAAEAHGVLCGLLCASVEGDADAQIVELLSPYGLEPEEEKELVETLGSLYRYSRASFDQDGFTFHLLLPDEDEPVAARVEGIADWCRGFLYGLTEGGVTDLGRLPGDAAEIAQDFLNIADAVPDEDEADVEAQEKALSEIEEYIRVGVQLIFVELYAKSRSTTHTKH